MKVNRGKIHKYLGITLDFSIGQQVKVAMVDSVKEVIAAWDKALKPNHDGFKLLASKKARKGKTCAAPEDLFKVDEDATNLTRSRARPSIILRLKLFTW